MTGNLLIGLVTMMVCLALQSILLLAARRYYIRHIVHTENPSFGASIAVVNVIMVLLVLGNLGQIAVWAMVFVWLGEFADFATAYYHSGVNFTSLGYGDIVMSEQRRLLGPLQSVNGVVMIGVSTASLMSAFQDAMTRTIKARS